MKSTDALASPHPGILDFPLVVRLAKGLLVAMREDPEREGLVDTSQRWARIMRHFLLAPLCT